MGLTAAAGGFVVFLLSVAAVPGVWRVTYTFRQICATRGSTVDMHCTYTYPPQVTTVTQRFWFTKSDLFPLDTDSDYTGRVQYDCDDSECAVRIKNLTGDDSAEYKFRFITDVNGGKYTGSPGVILTVTDLQLLVTKITVHQSHTEAELKCQSICPHLSHVWFKNGLPEAGEETSSYTGLLNPGDKISCALRGHEDYCSSSLYALKFPSVSVSPSEEIMEGSSVTLTCSTDADIEAKYTWYKKNLNPEQLLSEKPQLVFGSIQSSDSGQYYCTAENELGGRTSEYFIDVKYAPKSPSVSVSPSAEIEEGSSVNLTCSSDANPAAKYTWYKENQTLVQGPDGVHHFTSISSEDKGNYYCRSENQYGHINSPSLRLDVQYAPKSPSVSVSPSAEIEEGSSVTLTCSSDANPAANYTWYKENQTLVQGPDGVHHFTSISSEDKGNYYCRSENQYGQINSPSLRLDVQYAPKSPSVSVSPSAEIEEGSSVTLTCSSDANPAANYTWYKENQTLVQGPDGVHHFTSISSEDKGNYYCRSENQYGQINSPSLRLDVQYAPKSPSVSVSPSAEIEEGSSVTLTCSSDANPAANYTWYKENQTLVQGPDGVHHFTSISSEDKGNYYCRSENQYGQINSPSLRLDVQYAPKPPSVSACPSTELVEGSSVTLSCSSDANPAAEYTWYKEDEDSPKASGQIFIIADFRAEHSGSYYCEVKNSKGSHRSALHLTVGAHWKLIAAGTVTATILTGVILISVLLWIKKKKAHTQSPKPAEKPDNSSQKQPAEQEDNLHYARVHFSKKQADPLYCNTAQLQKHGREGEVGSVEYTTLKFNSGSNAPG